MGQFMGGSPVVMAREISEGYIIVTERTFKRMSRAEMLKLKTEIDRLLTSLRAEQSPTDDPITIQKRNRKIARLNHTLRMIQQVLMRRK